MKIKAVLDEGTGQKMERELNGRFTSVIGKFRTGFRRAFTGLKYALAGGAIAGVVSSLLNPLQKANQEIDAILAKAGNLQDRAKQFGTTNSRYLQLSSSLQAMGVDEGQIDQIFTRFQSLLSNTKKGEQNVLRNFKNEDDTAIAFYKFVEELRKTGQTDRAQRDIWAEDAFGLKATGRLAKLLEEGFDNTLEKVFKGIDVKAFNPGIDKLAGLEEQQAIRRQRNANEDLLVKARIIKPRTIRQKTDKEKQDIASTNKDIAGYGPLSQLEQNTKEMTGELKELRKELAPALSLATKAATATVKFTSNQINKIKNTTAEDVARSLGRAGDRAKF